MFDYFTIDHLPVLLQDKMYSTLRNSRTCTTRYTTKDTYHTVCTARHTSHDGKKCAVSCPICRDMYVLSCNKKTKWFLSHTTCTVRHVQIISISCADSTSHDIHITTYIVCTLKTKKLHLTRHTSHDIYVLFQYIMSWLNSTRHTLHDIHWIHIHNYVVQHVVPCVVWCCCQKLVVPRMSCDEPTILPMMLS